MRERVIVVTLSFCHSVVHQVFLKEKSENFSVSSSSYGHTQYFGPGKLTWVITTPLHLSSLLVRYTALKFSKTACVYEYIRMEQMEREQAFAVLLARAKVVPNSSKTRTTCLH